jgi:hypothetical protein
MWIDSWIGFNDNSVHGVKKNRHEKKYLKSRSWTFNIFFSPLI